MPPGCTSRFREKWQPLARVAQAAGPRWLALVMDRAARDVAAVAADRDAGLLAEKPAVLLLRHITQLWPVGQTFWGTHDMVQALTHEHPEAWGDESPFGKALTMQRMGRMLATNYDIRSTQEDSADKFSTRGYRRSMFAGAREALSARSGGSPDGSSDPLPKPSERPEPSEPSEADPDHLALTPSTAVAEATETAGYRCPSCGGPISAERALLELECLDCYAKTKETA